MKMKLSRELTLIGVGNLTLGGTGKSPIVTALGNYFSERNINYGIVSSGYGRKSNKDVYSTGQKITNGEIGAASVDIVGDEVLMMAENLPKAEFAISKSKSHSIDLFAAKSNSSIAIIDDAYQHPEIRFGLNILLIDATHDLRKESFFPLGRMRESLSQAKRADVIILTKTNMGADLGFVELIYENFADRLIVEAEFSNESLKSSTGQLMLNEIENKSIYFFAGIGNSDLLIKSLSNKVESIAGFRSFPDHCAYGSKEIAQILSDLIKYKPDIIATTQKDYVKIRHIDFGQSLYYLDLKLSFTKGQQELFDLLNKAAGINGKKV